MRKKIFVLTFVALLFTICFSVDAQQPAKIRRIGYLSISGPRNFRSAVSRHSGKGFEISVMLKGKTFYLSIATLKESRIRSRALWQNLCNSRWMSLSPPLYR
jgi:hypothetical protein